MKKDRQTRRSSPTPAAEGREAVDGTRFTQRARTALTLAQACAAELGHSYVGSEHLLLGLAREEQGMAARVLRTAGLYP